MISNLQQGAPIRPEKEDLELETMNHTSLLNLAANRMENIFWFGILEDIDRSLEMLQHQLGVESKV
jgi:hypothetical protein